VLVIAGVAAWLTTLEPKQAQFQSSIMDRLAPKKIDLPTVEVTESLSDAIKVLKGVSPAFPSVDEVEPSLIILYEEEAQTPEEEARRRMPVSISTIFMGPPTKFAILNGTIYREGETLPDGRLIKAIDQGGVTLFEDDMTERVAWVPPFRVELKQPEMEESMVFRPEETLSPEADAPLGQPKQQLDLQNLPSDLSPDQALEVLQQLGGKQ
jgi:hypothetical protein